MADPLASLQVALEGEVPRVIEITSPSFTVGRSAPGFEPDLALDDPDSFISRRHCVFTHAWGSWWVEDCESRNGTFMRDEGSLVAVTENTQLGPADVVVIVAAADDDGPKRLWELRLVDPNATNTLIGTPALASGAVAARPSVRWDAAVMRLEVVGDGEPRQVELRKQGYDLIAHMVERNASNGGDPVVCTTQELLEAVWGDPAEWDRYRPPTSENLRDLVLAVRKAIEPDSKHPVILENQRGVGYRLHSVG